MKKRKNYKRKNVSMFKAGEKLNIHIEGSLAELKEFYLEMLVELIQEDWAKGKKDFDFSFLSAYLLGFSSAVIVDIDEEIGFLIDILGVRLLEYADFKEPGIKDFISKGVDENTKIVVKNKYY